MPRQLTTTGSLYRYLTAARTFGSFVVFFSLIWCVNNNFPSCLVWWANACKWVRVDRVTWLMDYRIEIIPNSNGLGGQISEPDPYFNIIFDLKEWCDKQLNYLPHGFFSHQLHTHLHMKMNFFSTIFLVLIYKKLNY